MSEKKWTKGPWEIGTSGPNQMPTVGTIDGLMVAHISIGINHPGEENAHLVAAAPELYDMLEHAKNALESLPQDSLGFAGGIGVVCGEVADCTYPIRDELLSNIDAALAKARGKYKFLNEDE